MKILFISTRLPHARVVSGHLIVYQRVKRLAERGHEIGLAVFAREDDEAHVAEVRPLVRDLEIIPAPPRTPLRKLGGFLFSSVPEPFAAFYSPRMLRCVGDLVERGRYDVALSEFAYMGQYLNRNPYLPAVRKIVSVHQCQTTVARKELELRGVSPRAAPAWFAMKGLERYEFDIYRHADHILVLTAEERFDLLNYAPDLRTTVIPSGVDTSFFQPADPALKEEAIVFTGNYSDEPNRDAVMWFVHAVWPALKERRKDLVFYVVGPSPTPAMQDRARKDPQIRVTGEVPDIRPYLARARVFVSPSRLGSGMRGKLLQAMASGLPVVSTTLGAEGISIQMGDTGFLADTPHLMAQAIHLLLDDRTLQETVGRRARAMVCERFSWNLGVDQLEGVLRDVVSGK